MEIFENLIYRSCHRGTKILLEIVTEFNTCHFMCFCFWLMDVHIIGLVRLNSCSFVDVSQRLTLTTQIQLGENMTQVSISSIDFLILEVQ